VGVSLRFRGWEALPGVGRPEPLVSHVVAAPVVGLLADRASRPRLVVASAARGFGCALAVTAAGLGRLPLPVVLAVLVAGGCCGPALTGGLTSQLSALVPGERLPRAFGLDSLTYNSAGIIGSAVAAVLVAATAAALAAAALAAGAVTGAVLIAVLPIRAQHPSLGTPGPSPRAATDPGPRSCPHRPPSPRPPR